MSELPRVLRAPQVAELLDVSVGLVYALGRRGELPVLRMGRSMRFPRDRILALIEDVEIPLQEQRPPTERGASGPEPSRDRRQRDDHSTAG